MPAVIMCLLLCDLDETPADVQSYLNQAVSQHAAFDFKGNIRQLRINLRSNQRRRGRRSNQENIKREIDRLEKLKDEPWNYVPQICIWHRNPTGLVGALSEYSSRFPSKLQVLDVLQVVDDSSVFCKFGGTRYLLSGISTKDIADDSWIKIKGLVFEVAGTHTYTTVLGGSRTVVHYKAVDMLRVAPYLAKMKKDANEKEMREWMDGSARIIARYVDYARGEALLELGNGGRVSIPLNRLSQKDQKFIRTKIRNQRLGR